MYSAQLIMLAMVLDGFDGNLARLLKATTRFGAEFDTFVDSLCFGVAPAFLAYQSALHEFGALGLFLCAAMVLSGAMRLSRLRVVDPSRGQGGFLGLPITINAAWVALWIMLTNMSTVDHHLYSSTHGPVAAMIWICSTAFVILQMSHIRYPKPTKDPVFFIPSVFMVVLLFLKVQVAVASALAICLYGPFYAFCTPFLKGAPATAEEEEPSLEYPPI